MQGGRVAHVKDHRPELLSVEIQQEVSCQNWELGDTLTRGPETMFWSDIYLEGVWVGSSNHTVQGVRKMCSDLTSIWKVWWKTGLMNKHIHQSGLYPHCECPKYKYKIQNTLGHILS